MEVTDDISLVDRLKESGTGKVSSRLIKEGSVEIAFPFTHNFGINIFTSHYISDNYVRTKYKGIDLKAKRVLDFSPLYTY